MTTAITDRGTWTKEKEYFEFDRVAFKGALYVCKYPEPHIASNASMPGTYPGMAMYWSHLSDALEQLPEVEKVPAFSERRILRIWFPDETYHKGQNVFFAFEIWECLQRAEPTENPETHPWKWKSVQGNDDETTEGGGEGSLSDTTSPPYPGYEFTFEEEALIWEVVHNFGCKRFYFEIYDITDRQHFGWTREYMDGNTVRIYFNEPIAGRVQMWALQPKNRPLNDLGVTPVCQTVQIYEEDFPQASNEWVISHSLNIRKIKCQVFDEEDRQHFAFQKNVVNNQIVQLKFEQELSGHVRLIPMTG